MCACFLTFPFGTTRCRSTLTAGRRERSRTDADDSRLWAEVVIRDTRSVLTYIQSLPLVAPRVGVLGYGMGGQLALAAAAALPDQVKACASLDGVCAVSDAADSPHRLVSQLAPDTSLYLGFAEHSGSLRTDDVTMLRTALDANDVDYTLETLPGTEHGFCFPDRPQHHEPAAERVWEALLDLFRRQLRD